MENIEEKEIDIEDIGTILKSSRLKSKKSLEEISSELCIRKIYLTALEEGDYETLEPIPYGVGYVRTYARYLGLNPERAVKLYKTAAFNEEEEKEQTEETVSEPQANKSNKWHIVGGFVALILVCGLWNLLTKNGEPGQTNQAEEKIINEEENAVDNDVIAMSTKEVDETDETDNKDMSEKKEETSVVFDKTLENDTKKDTKEPVEEKVIAKDKVIMEFSGETWIEIKDKNKIYIQGVFHKGDKKEINYVKNLYLSVGRPGNLTLYVNGEIKNVLAKHRKSNIPVDSLQ